MSDIWNYAALFIIGMLAGRCLSMSVGVIWRQDMAMSDVKSDLLENCIKERTRLHVELKDAHEKLAKKSGGLTMVDVDDMWDDDLDDDAVINMRRGRRMNNHPYDLREEASRLLREEAYKLLLREEIEVHRAENEKLAAKQFVLDAVVLSLHENKEKLRAALDDLLAASKRLIICAQTTGGTAGRDDGLVEAIANLEQPFIAAAAALKETE